MDKDLIKI